MLHLKRTRKRHFLKADFWSTAYLMSLMSACQTRTIIVPVNTLLGWNFLCWQVNQRTAACRPARCMNGSCPQTAKQIKKSPANWWWLCSCIVCVCVWCDLGGWRDKQLKLLSSSKSARQCVLVINTVSPTTDRQLSGSCLEQSISFSVKPKLEALVQHTQSHFAIKAESKMLFLCATS